MAENHKDPPSGTSAATKQQKQDRAESAPAIDNTFLSSMTFTSLQREDICCDCDECGVTNTSSSDIPPSILQALHRYKKRKLESSPIRRTQCRTLVKRSLAKNNVAVWTWTMPRGADPLVEFGNSHRIIWVQRLPENSLVKAIGKGVLGSSHEEKNRTVMDWKQGGVYLVPANGGKAVGWIHEKTKESSLKAKNESIESSGGPVVLLMAKIPIASLTAADEHDDDKEGDTKDAWASLILKICSAALEQGENAASPPLLGQSFHVSETDAILLKEIMSS